MAAGTVTQIQDLLVPDVWHPYMLQLTTELDAFIQSGVAVDMTEMLEEFGLTINLPFLNDLDASDNVSSDTADIAINPLTSGKDIAVKLMRDQAFGATDLSSELSGADPMQAIAMRIGKYWMRMRQRALLSTLQGAFSAANIGPNVLDISGLSGSAAVFDADSFIDATHQLGDHSESLAAVAVHSDTQKAMKKMDLIDFIKPSTGGEPIPFYQGRRVIVDDLMPVSNGIYDTYVFGPGAVAYATKPRRMPVEAWREPLKNGGREYIVTREQWTMHPRGIKWIGTPAGETPSNTELAVGTNWSKVYDTKNIRIVRFRHKLPS